MAWFKVDDKLWGHPKWLATPPRARGLWVSAGSWSASNETDGLVPTHALAALGGTKADAGALVRVGLWHPMDDGYRFHEWTRYQPDAASLRAKRSAESDAATLGNHRRWHLKRGVRVPGCDHCADMPPNQVPDQVPDWVPDDDPIRYSDSGANPPVPVPIPTQSPRTGGSPKQREGEHPQQACGRRHDPADACGACGAARRRDTTNDLEAQRAKSKRERDAHRADRERRQAEAAQAAAEAEADPDAIARARARAKAAITAARGGDQ